MFFANFVKTPKSAPMKTYAKYLALFAMFCQLPLSGQVPLGRNAPESPLSEALENADSLIQKDEYDAARTLLDKHKAEMTSATPPSLSGRYWYEYGKACFHLSQKGESLEMLEKAKPLLLSVGDSVRWAYAHYLCGQQLIYDDIAASSAQLQTATAFFGQKGGDKKYLAQCYAGMGTLLASKGDLDKCYIYTRKAIDTAKEVGDESTTAYVAIGAGINFMNAGETDKGERFMRQAIESAKKIHDQHLLAPAMMYLGGSLVDRSSKGSPELAEGKALLDRASAIYTALKDSARLGYINNYYASYYCGEEDYASALKHSGALVAYAKSVNHTVMLASSCRQRGIIFEHFNQPDSARYYYTMQADIAQKDHNLIILREAYKSLYALEKKAGNFEKALGYHEKYATWRDSIYNEELKALKSVESVKQDVEGAERAKNEAVLEAKLLQTKNHLYTALAGGLLVLLLAGGYLFFKTRQSRQKIAQQNQQLTQLNETKDRFLGIIAHDIRSPISALSGVGEQMEYLLEKKDEAKLQRLAKRVEETAQKLSNLLDNLLHWALLQKGMIPYSPSPLNVAEVVDENLQLYQELADHKGILLENHVPAGTTSYADPDAFSAIMRNLVNNGIKFTSKGGTVSVSTKNEEDKVFIEVNDTGTGIAADKLERIFKLNTLRSKGTSGEKGTGLGLTLCKDLIAINKGTIKVVSELGKGSSFIVSLPR
jgi:signal transduction histidine kinase